MKNPKVIGYVIMVNGAFEDDDEKPYKTVAAAKKALVDIEYDDGDKITICPILAPVCEGVFTPGVIWK